MYFERVTFLRSMTGYGRSVSHSNGYDILFEIRSVNHRFLECSVKVPRGYGYLEDKIKERVQQQVSRGKVEVILSMTRSEEKHATVHVNHELVSAYIQALHSENARLAEEFSDGVSKDAYLQQDIGLSTLLSIPDAFQVEEEEEDAKQILQMVLPVLDDAIYSFISMRNAEGQNMQQDIAEKLNAISEMRQQIETLAEESTQKYYDRLNQRLHELLEDQTIDESRLITEVAILADKTAIDEELIRLDSHIAQMQSWLNSDEPVGRKMDFLVQELNREVNTIGSKSQSLEITRLVIDIKAEIEKIREQVQNIE